MEISEDLSARKDNVLALLVMMLEALSGFAICPLCLRGSVQPSVRGQMQHFRQKAEVPLL